MNEDEVKESITQTVLPALKDEFMKADSAFFIYIEYDEVAKGVKTLIVPAPPEELVEEVTEEVAKKIYAEMNQLPSLIIICEQIKYLKQGIDEVEQDDIDVDLLDSGIVLVAVDARTAEGFITLYKLPDMEEMITNRFDSGSEDIPSYAALAASAFMRQTIKEAGLVEEEDDEQMDDSERRSEVQFKFSRN